MSLFSYRSCRGPSNLRRQRERLPLTVKALETPTESGATFQPLDLTAAEAEALSQARGVMVLNPFKPRRWQIDQ
jgi:hypothetical protein